MISERMATPLVARVMLAALAAAIVAKASRWTGWRPSASPRELIDFDAFYIAGQMAWRGDIADAYHFPALMRAQLELGGSTEFLPWTYPPPFNLVAAGLTTLPTWLAYLLFTGGTLIAFALVLRRLAGPMFAAVVFTVFPALATVIACGQNGFLTGALIGLACLGLMRDRTAAGLPLGLMVIKPHLAVTFAVYVALARRWACLLVAASVAFGCAALATLAFGIGIWTAFVQGVHEAGGFLISGYYPLHRMVSVYASLRSFDLAPSLAMLAQAGSALIALGFVVAAVRLRLPTRQVLGLTSLCNLLVSPYAYDYDLTLYAVALALLMPDLLARTSDREQMALAVLSWMACGYGLASSAAIDILALPDRAETATPAQVLDVLPPSLVGPVLVLLIAFLWRVLRRPETRASESSVPDHVLSVTA